MTAILRNAGAAPAFVHQGLPSFIRASLYEAGKGGDSGYETVGRQLGRALEYESPHAAEDAEWTAVLASVDDLLDDDDELGRWLRQTYPKISRSVPPRRWRSFVSGVRAGRLDYLNA